MALIFDEKFEIYRDHKESDEESIDKIRERVEGKVGAGIDDIDNEEVKELDELL